MGWSEYAPSLPAGSGWSGWLTSNANTSNNYNSFRVSARIARGQGRTVFVHVIIQCAGKTYGQTGNTNLSAQVAVGGGGYEGSGTYACSAGYADWTNCKNLYWTGEADAGATVYARVYWTASQTAGPVTFSAPALLAIPVYVNAAGAVHQVTAAYANVGGAVKQCDVYTNVGGVIKQLR